MRKRFADIVRSERPARRVVVLLVSVGVLLAVPSILRAKQEVACEECKPGIALPGEKCRVEPLPEWSEPERWAWACICEGKAADFNERLGEKLDPIDPHEWSYDNRWSTAYKWPAGRRTLSPRFLKTILLHEPFRSAVPPQGVRIIGAYFKDAIDLSDASIEWPLALRESLFKSSSMMRRLRTPKFVSFDGSRFDGELDMSSATIRSNLNMLGEAKFVDVDLRGAKIGGQLDMSSSTFKGMLDMDSISIKSNLLMGQQAEFNDVILEGAKIGGQVVMSGTTFKGLLNMNSVLIGSNLFMNQKAEFCDILLIGGKIGGQFDMSDSTFKGAIDKESGPLWGDLEMDEIAKFCGVVLFGTKIEGYLDMSGSTFKGTLSINSVSIWSDLRMNKVNIDKPAELKFLKVGSNFIVRGASLRELDLTGTKVRDNLVFGLSDDGENIKWENYEDEDGKSHNPKLTLRNASVGALELIKDAWPEKRINSSLGLFLCTEIGTLPVTEHACHDETKPLELELDGFTYQRIGAGVEETPKKRGSKWYVEWLLKDGTYSPQPYRHLASVLRDAGHEDMADEILYANRAREHRESDISWRRWVFLWVLWVTVGYGYGWLKFLALVWVGVLVMLGTFILHIAGERDKIIAGFLKRACYSLDMLLPVIRLREQHYKDVDLITWARYYFYFHQIMGYVLILFVLAGLSGLVE